MLARALAAATILTCMMMVLTVTVFAKTTYVITDGNTVTVHKSYETNPEKVLDHLGVQLGHTDKYVTQPSWGRHEITIQRAKNVTVELYGQTVSIVSYDETVEALLHRMAVTVPKNGVVSPGMDALLYDGICVTVQTTFTVEESFTQPIAFDTVYVKTDYLPAGESVVLTEGTNGTAKCFGPVTYVNGKVTKQFAMSRITQTQPVDRLIAVGTGTGKAEPGAPVVGQNKLLTWDGQVLEFTHSDVFKATSYYRFPVDGEITAMGTHTRVGAIAVDPTVIPYWTKMYIVTQDGEYIYGVAVAEDCGTAIKGKWVDLFYETYEEACKFGRRQVDIYFLA